jgi:hypothetical protein
MKFICKKYDASGSGGITCKYRFEKGCEDFV